MFLPQDEKKKPSVIQLCLGFGGVRIGDFLFVFLFLFQISK